MTSTLQATKNAITLKGSTAIISDYLKYGINSILFQRGIYPPEDFQSTQQYGLTILVSTNNKIQEFLQNILTQTETFLSRNELEKISMVITDAHTKEALECWEFQVQCDDTSEMNQENINGTKDLKRIQMEIGSVMRQISATVSYLPLLDNICSFDILLQTKETTEVPEKWDETSPVCIQNAQSVQLRSFSTGVHTVNTAVNASAFLVHGPFGTRTPNQTDLTETNHRTEYRNLKLIRRQQIEKIKRLKMLNGHWRGECIFWMSWAVCSVYITKRLWSSFNDRIYLIS